MMANNVLNQLVQHYVSSEIPELLQVDLNKLNYIRNNY